ncbi:MAG: hypothetical protein ABII02_03240 [Candidatus Magasanikbacteria bacterium]
MKDVTSSHTIEIFSRLFNLVESVLPEKLHADMEKALESLRTDLSLTMDEVEDTVILFGKKAWPYRKALGEFVSAHEAHHGEDIFIAKLSRDLAKRYRLFNEQGGSFRDLHSGNNIVFFTSAERIALCSVLIEVKKEIRTHVIQDIKSARTKEFGKRVQEFQEIFSSIEDELAHLVGMADEEQEYPHLASEIRSHVRGFEFGLSLLGPETRYEAVCRAADHFHGRKKDLRHMI